MNPTAVREVVLFVAFTLALGLIHTWHESRMHRRKMAAEEALRLDKIRQQAVKQLKIEQQAWSRRAGQEDAQPAMIAVAEEVPIRT
jgi:hypothetical protein